MKLLDLVDCTLRDDCEHQSWQEEIPLRLWRPDVLHALKMQFVT